MTKRSGDKLKEVIKNRTIESKLQEQGQELMCLKAKKDNFLSKLTGCNKKKRTTERFSKMFKMLSLVKRS